MGALTYYPERKFPEQQDNPDLDELARECQKILNTEYTDKLDEQMCIRDRHTGEYFHGPFETTDKKLPMILLMSEGRTRAVSYTHLDVYKRQPTNSEMMQGTAY